VINAKPSGEPVFLSEDRLERGYAYCISPHRSSANENPEPAPRPAVLNRYEEEKQDQQHKVELAKLEAEWKQYTDSKKEIKVKTLADQKKEAADNEYSAMMGIHEWADKKRAEAAEQHKNDSERLKDANEAIAKIERKHS